jgi:hypothetical protein
MTRIKHRSGEASIIATLMLLAITIFTTSITLSFVQNSLAHHQGESDLTFAKVFMNTLGLQIDDVAWLPGQMDMVQYSSQYAEMYLKNNLLNYQIQVKYIGVPGETTVASFQANPFFFNIPTNVYTLDNTYFENILPGTVIHLIQNGTNAPVARVFAIQRNPIGNESDYIRVCVVPVPRVSQYSITTDSGTTRYLKMYMVNLVEGNSTTQNPKYVTSTGKGVSTQIFTGVESVTVTLNFPKSSDGYNNGFFMFPETLQTISLGGNSFQLEIYQSTIEIGFLK